jgi:hypothetical protein
MIKAANVRKMAAKFPAVGKLGGYPLHIHSHYELYALICETTGRLYCKR